MKSDTQVSYKILSRPNPAFLEEDIAEWTHDGYHLVGGIAVYLDQSGKPVFVQAVAAETE